MSTPKAAPESPVYRPHDEDPPRPVFRSIDATGPWSGLDGRGFELVSRGDFVRGVVHLPDSSHPAPSPLVLLIHATGSAAETAALDFAAEWVRSGLAVARIDLPLHGRRASPKLSARLVEGYRRVAAGESLDLDTRALVEEFARQSTSDLIRTTEALGQLPEIDAQRTALAGLGVGAAACLWAAMHAPGLRACLLAGGVGRLADAALDPTGLLRQARTGEGCAWLMLTPKDDPAVSHQDADALFEALPAPRERAETAPTTVSGGLSDEAASVARAFLARALALSP